MKKTITALAAATMALAGAFGVQAGEYPEKPVSFIVPWPPGDLEDVLTRIIAEDFQKKYGVAAAVVNKPGGGGGASTDRTMLPRLCSEAASARRGRGAPAAHGAGETGTCRTDGRRGVRGGQHHVPRATSLLRCNRSHVTPRAHTNSTPHAAGGCPPVR